MPVCPTCEEKPVAFYSIETCMCDFAKRHPDYRVSSVSEYLRALADRVDRGEVRHVSISAHPVEDA